MRQNKQNINPERTVLFPEMIINCPDTEESIPPCMYANSYRLIDIQ